MKTTRWLALLSLVFFVPASNAGIMLEPWLGYEPKGKMDCTDITGDPCGGDGKGMHYGARVGYKLPVIGLWFAGEYNGSSGYEAENPPPDPADKLTHTALGVTAGIDLIFGLRVFAGYFFQEKLEVKSSSSKLTLDGGNMIKFGAGYKFPLLPVAVNVESYSATYEDGTLTDTASGATATFKVKDFFQTFKRTGIIVSVSAPFDF